MREISHMILTKRFIEALNYSFDLNICRSGEAVESSYVAHCLSVAAIVIEHDGDEDQAIASLLHEVTEGAGDALALLKIHDRFGERVAKIVQACAGSISTVTRARDASRLCKPENYPSIREKPADAILVSLADNIHTSRAILSSLKIKGDEVWDRLNCDSKCVLRYYRYTVEGFKFICKESRVQNIMIKEFEAIVHEIESVNFTNRNQMFWG